MMSMAELIAWIMFMRVVDSASAALDSGASIMSLMP
jgi:hypothetical protein